MQGVCTIKFKRIKLTCNLTSLIYSLQAAGLTPGGIWLFHSHAIQKFNAKLWGEGPFLRHCVPFFTTDGIWVLCFVALQKVPTFDTALATLRARFPLKVMDPKAGRFLPPCLVHAVCAFVEQVLILLEVPHLGH